jgi:hypothetical protein
MTMRSWIRNVFTRPAPRPIRKAPHRKRLSVEALEDRTVPSTFSVLNTLDDGSVGSLRWAVEQANLNAGADSIEFDSSVFSSPQTITLTDGPLMLTDAAATAITGPGANLLSISGNNESLVFAVNSGASGDLSGLTITKGYSFYGGGLLNSGTLALSNCTVSGNSAFAGGGLLNFYGTATLTDCTVSGNSATTGGGLFNALGSLSMSNSTISNNSADFGGGGVRNFAGPLTLTNCTISGNSVNSSGSGGGLYNVSYGTATLTNCTVSGNSAGHTGGGLSIIEATATLINCTVSGNSAGTGAGMYLSASAATLTNTIVAGQAAGGDIFAFGGVFGSNNLIGTGGSGGLINGVNGNIVGVADPGLAPLADNGGPTQTMALLPGSPAIDAGTSGPGIPATDQRGLGRVGAVDIGAFEVQAQAQPPTITVPDAQTAYEDVDLVISGINVDGDPQGDTPFTLTLAAGHGTLTLADTSGLTVSGNGSGSVSLSGSIDDINAALTDLVYRGGLNYSGPDTLSLMADDGNLSTLASVSIDVKSAAQQAADLQAQASALGLNHGQTNSLIVKLNLKGNDGDAGKVKAFLNEIGALLNADRLTQADADALRELANILLLSIL